MAPSTMVSPCNILSKVLSLDLWLWKPTIHNSFVWDKKSMVSMSEIRCHMHEIDLYVVVNLTVFY